MDTERGEGTEAPGDQASITAPLLLLATTPTTPLMTTAYAPWEEHGSTLLPTINLT